MQTGWHKGVNFLDSMISARESVVAGKTSGDPGVKNLPSYTRDMGFISGPGRAHMPWVN